ncbi:MAG: hypothetical protein AAF599_19770 [Bacteroidota bacterium]
MKFSGELLENQGDVVELHKLNSREESIFHHFPIIESLLPTFRNSKKMNVFIPRIESRNGVMKERVYDLTIETIIRYEQRLLKCTIEDLTEHYSEEAKVQQQLQEKAIAVQTQA